MNQGYVKVWRKIRESKVWKNPDLLKLFLFCLLEARHTNCTTEYAGRSINLRRGQFVIDIKALARRLGACRTTTLYRLKVLKVDTRLDIKSTNKYSIITVLNYPTYQGLNSEKLTSVSTSKPKKLTSKPVYNNNVLKNVIKKREGESSLEVDIEKKYISVLIAFWKQENEKEAAQYGTKKAREEICRAMDAGITYGEIGRLILKESFHGLPVWELFKKLKKDASQLLIKECPVCRRPAEESRTLKDVLAGSGLRTGCDCSADQCNRRLRQIYPNYE